MLFAISNGYVLRQCAGQAADNWGVIQGFLCSWNTPKVSLDEICDGDVDPGSVSLDVFQQIVWVA
jgi:hypothetical protein